MILVKTKNRLILYAIVVGHGYMLVVSSFVSLANIERLVDSYRYISVAPRRLQNFVDHCRAKLEIRNLRHKGGPGLNAARKSVEVEYQPDYRKSDLEMDLPKRDLYQLEQLVWLLFVRMIKELEKLK